MDRDDLEALIARAQDGDARAFGALLEGHLAQVRRFARAFSASEADADDLAQDALVRAYERLRSFRYQSAFSTWLFALVRNVFLDAARGRAGTRRAREEPLAPVHAEREGGARPDLALEVEQDRRRLWAALREVPAEYRAALVLFDLEGCTYDEVAAIEGVAVGTVKSRLHRGRAHLRGVLEREGPERAAAAPAVPAQASPPAGTSAGAAPSHRARRS